MESPDLGSSCVFAPGLSPRRLFRQNVESDDSEEHLIELFLLMKMFWHPRMPILTMGTRTLRVP